MRVSSLFTGSYRQLFFASAFVSVLLSSGAVRAAENPNRIRDLGHTDGATVEAVYADGRIAQVYRKERLDEFRVPVELSDNTCKPFRRHVCTMVIPFARQYLAAVWKRHPTREGQNVSLKNDPKTIFGNQVFVTRSQNTLFETILSRIPFSAGQSEKIKSVLADKSMGRIECDSDLTQSMPNAKEITFWDENYEGGNVELAMSEGFGTRVNQNWRRVEGLPTEVQKNILKFSRFKKEYGQFTDYYPLGVSYQLQFTFRASNIIDPDDEACMMKWDVNFTQYFTQLVGVLNFAGQGPFNPAEYELFKSSGENMNPFAQKIYTKELWETEATQ